MHGRLLGAYLFGSSSSASSRKTSAVHMGFVQQGRLSSADLVGVVVQKVQDSLVVPHAVPFHPRPFGEDTT